LNIGEIVLPEEKAGRERMETIENDFFS